MVVVSREDPVGDDSIEFPHGYIGELPLLFVIGIIDHITAVGDKYDIEPGRVFPDPSCLRQQNVRIGLRVVLRVRQDHDRIVGGVRRYPGNNIRYPGLGSAGAADEAYRGGHRKAKQQVASIS